MTKKDIPSIRYLLGLFRISIFIGKICIEWISLSFLSMEIHILDEKRLLRFEESGDPHRTNQGNG